MSPTNLPNSLTLPAPPRQNSDSKGSKVRELARLCAAALDELGRREGHENTEVEAEYTHLAEELLSMEHQEDAYVGCYHSEIVQVGRKSVLVLYYL